MQIVFFFFYSKDLTPRSGAYKMKRRKQVKPKINYAKGNNYGHFVI